MKSLIPYYPELREILPNLGFNSSTQLFSYLRKCDVYFMYDRTSASEDRIPDIIKEQNEIAKKHKAFNTGFIFVMDHPEYDFIEVIHLFFLSKDRLIKYLQLKAFS